FSSRRRHTRFSRDWSSDVCSSDLGAITDIDGTYTVEVPQGSNVLVFSFVGFTTQNVTIGNRSEVNVVLAPDVRELSEVVITALGVERNRNELAYSAQEVQGDQITRTRTDRKSTRLNSS